jgi:hypothetical protein
MSEFFVRRPIVAIVIAILMTLIGGVCILALPIAQYPQIAPPEIQVQTHYTGADALTIEQSVAAPIEQQMSGVDNMNYMYTIGQYKHLTTNYLWDCPTSVPEIFGDEHGVFHGLKLQEIFPSASPDTAARGGQAE